MKSFHPSKLSRDSADVFRAAEEAPIEVTRRDGQSLTLMSSQENDERNELLELAAQIIAITTLDDGRTLTDRFADHFSWILVLPQEDRDRCASELISAARASFATKQAHLAISTLIAWKETATAYAEGWANEPLDWLAQRELVERP